MPTPARVLAFSILLDSERGPTPLADLLARPEAEGLPRRERGFLHELVLGTLRRRGAVDHALAPLARRSLDGLDPAVRAALRLGAYQVLFLRVPARAAVDESVDLAGAAQPRARGFVNAVLRRLAREGPRDAPDPARDPLGWLTSAGSLPAWLAQRWLARLGAEQAVRRAEAFLEPPPAAFRLNPRVPDALVRARVLEPKPLTVPGAWEATASGATDLATEGVLYLQDQGSQLVARLALGGALTLDACAAPGGKAMLLADEGSAVVAAEVSLRRLRILGALCGRWGATGVRAVGADARRPPFRAVFDVVLLDAPCSGLGTIGRNPDIRWRAQPEDLPRHAAKQAELLRSLAPLVRPGGRLVYATCSLEPEENEGVLEPFLEANPGFGPAGIPAWVEPFRDGPHVRTLPERDRGDGFFIAALEKA